MTVTITDTVTETEIRDGKYAAQVVRTRSVLSSSIELDELSEARELFVPDEAPFAKWYIFENDLISSQLDFLDWSALDSALVEFQFPFKEAECWYPDPTAPRTCPVNEPPWYVGFRIVQPLEDQNTPVGDYTDCYSIQEVYNSRPTILRFCDGVGVVGEDYDHSGTPFGSHSVLVKFTPGIE